VVACVLRLAYYTMQGLIITIKKSSVKLISKQNLSLNDFVLQNTNIHVNFTEDPISMSQGADNFHLFKITCKELHRFEKCKSWLKNS